MLLSRVAPVGLTLAVAVAASPATAQDRPPPPCESGSPFTDFDFWVGEWDVFVADGSRAGTNTIEKVERGCLLLEHWTGAAGGTGKSMNFYDPGRERWRQVWVSANGVLIEIAGGLDDRGAMVLQGALTDATGASQPFRGTWTPNTDGSVRQHFEISQDAGRSWVTWFDGRYVRRR